MQTKKNNKGVSLVEVMVAIAIGSIVLAALSLLIVHSVNSYRKQTVLSNIQNEANITMNQMSDNIMEATCIEISNTSDSTSYIQLKTDVVYIYNAEKGTLYQAKQRTPDVLSNSTASVLCENIKYFKVEIVDTGLVVGDNGIISEIYNPIQLKVTLELERMDESRRISRIISIRNEMPKIMYGNGDTSSNIIGVSKNSLSMYITSED